MTAGKQLRVLLLEDLASDAELVQLQLEDFVRPCEFQVAKTKAVFVRLLSEFDPHIVIADFHLPGFTGLQALSILRKKDDLTPFIFVTGTLGEDKAVEAIRSGATDFIIKNRVEHLPAAVMRALREKKEKQRKKLFARQLEAIAAFNGALIYHEDWINALNQALEIIGEAALADRVYYFKNEEDPSTGEKITSEKIEWFRGSDHPQIDNPALQKIPFVNLPELLGPLSGRKTFKAVVAHLPDCELKTLLAHREVNSLLVLPIFTNNHFHGFIGFDDCKTSRKWSANDVSFLKTITGNMAVAIEKRLSAAAIKQSQERFESVINNVPGITYRCQADRNWTMQFMNNEAERLTGYPAEDFIGNKKRSFASIIHPDDLERTFKILEPLRRKEVFFLEYRIICKRGQIKWVEERGNGIYDDSGNLQWIDGVIMDVTENHKLEILLNQIHQLARIGGWEMDLTNDNQLNWTEVTRQLHEVPDNFQPDLETAINFYKEGKDREVISRAIDDAMTKGIPYDVEIQIITAKGNARWVRVIGKCEFNKDKCVRLFGSIQDINARKKAEEERGEILESITDGFFAIDRNWNVTYWNKAAEAMLQAPKEDILGKNIWQVFSEMKDLAFYEECNLAIKNQEVHTFEEYYSKFEMWVEVSVFPKPDGLSVYFKNITREKARKNEIITTKNLQESIANSTQDLIWAVDKKFRLIYSNKPFLSKMKDVTGNTFKLGMNLIEDPKVRVLIDEKEKKKWYSYYRQTFKKKALSVTEEYSFDGKKEIRLVNISPIYDHNNKVSGAACFSQDITERTQQVEAIEEQNKRLREIAWIQSHVVRAPLARLKGLVSILEMKDFDDLGNDLLLHHIMTSADQLDQVIREMINKASRVGRLD